ncbi:uncharacterized protein C1orf131 homolog isoform X2 [Notolabrus celidotus]|uniref:uncharacterized protein C1orf131 homolog isoform X2 n=1 Tax=Notolabrus celidotus TaxID=1203425 RepID=UPI00148FBC00|nr:uncharacterized protein C1orf131 homolog isoform X2 [Notolabrus celidotus]
MNTRTNGEEDEDSAFLEDVLDKLYDFGNGPASKKKNKSQKKKRKRCEEEKEREEEDFPVVGAWGCCDIDNKRTDHVIPVNQQGRSNTEQRGQTTPQVEVVTFQDPRKKQKTKQTPAPEKKPTTEKTESSEPEELNLEKARFEVHRFGITGYKKEQQRVFEQDRAVMLGARPPKKDYVNYKVLQQQIKDRKQKAKEEVNPELKKKKRKNNHGDKTKKVSSGSGGAPTGQVGRFKNGMLILSTKEIQKIKGNKRRK